MASQSEAVAVRQVNGDILNDARYELAEAQAEVDQSAVTAGHLAQLRAVQDSDVEFANLLAQYSERLFRIGSGTVEAVAAVEKSAAASAGYAKDATSAMAIAAADINAAAKAVDEYLKQVAGLAALLNQQAGASAVASQADAASKYAQDTIGATVGNLRQQALRANVLSATARAEAAETAAKISAKQLEGLADRANKSFQTATKHRASLIDSSADVAAKASSAEGAFVRYALSAAGAQTVAKKINQVANHDLKVKQVSVKPSGVKSADAKDVAPDASSQGEEVQDLEWFQGSEIVEEVVEVFHHEAPSANKPVDKTSGPGTPAIGASLVASAGDTADSSVDYYFYLVPARQRFSFHVASAKHLAQALSAGKPAKDGKGDSKPLPACRLGTFSKPKKEGDATRVVATLSSTIEGKPLNGGDDGYVVFVLRAPRGGIASCTEADLSLPSGQIAPVLHMPKLNVTGKAGDTTSDGKTPKTLFSIDVSASGAFPDEVTGIDLRCYLLRWDVYNALGDSASSVVKQQPVAFAQSNTVRVDSETHQMVVQTPDKDGKNESSSAQAAPQGADGAGHGDQGTSPTVEFAFGADNSDAFGDLLSEGTHYVAVVFALDATPQAGGGDVKPLPVGDAVSILDKPTLVAS